MLRSVNWYLPMCRDSLSVPNREHGTDRLSKKSATNYNHPEEQKPHLHTGGSLKSCLITHSLVILQRKWFYVNDDCVFDDSLQLLRLQLDTERRRRYKAESAAARLLVVRVRISPGHGCLSLVSVVCCQVEVSELG